MAEKQAGGLSLRIGLTLSQLQSDFLAAEQTVRQGIAALNRQQNIVKLKMETDVTGLDAIADKTKILEVQERGLTQLLEMQRDKLKLATVAYQDYANSKNANQAVTKNLEAAMERERLAVARLEAQLKSLSAQKVSIDTTHLQENISKLNSQIQHIKIKAEIDTTKLQDTGSVFDRQKVQIAAVTKELELQRQKLVQLREVMYRSANATGAGSIQTLTIKSNVLQQINEITKLEAKLKELQNTNVNLQIRADSIKQAEQTISENIARINAKVENIRVKTEIDVSKLGEAASEFDKAKAHVQGLSREIELQKQKLTELQKAFATSVSTNGLNNVKTINLQTEIQRQIQAIEQLEAKLKELNGIAPPKTNSLLSGYLNIKGDITGKLNSITTAFNQLQGATSSADSALTATLGVINEIPTPIGKAATALLSLPILFKGIENSIISMTEAAASAGDSVYVMSRGFQMSIADTGKFTTMCKTAGVEVNDLASTIKRTQQQIVRGGDDAKAEQWLRRYGESAFDANGKLKDLNAMTLTLSRALKRAQAEGNGMAFILATMRNASADAITAIEDAEGVYEQASTIVKNGLANPALAHEVQGNINAMKVQAGQLNASFESALLPVANEIIPRVTERMGKMTTLVKNNADLIKDFGKDLAEVWGGVESAVDKVTAGFSKLAELARENRVVRQTNSKDLVEKYKDDSTVQSVKDLLEAEIDSGGYSAEDKARLTSRTDLYSKELRRTEQDYRDLQKKRREEFAERYKSILERYKSDNDIKTATDLLNKLPEAEKELIAQDTTPFFSSLIEKVAALNLELKQLRETSVDTKTDLEALLKLPLSGADASAVGQERKALEQNEELINSLRESRKYREEAQAITDKLNLNDYQKQLYDLDRWLQSQLPREQEQSLEKYQAVMAEYQARELQIEREHKEKIQQIWQEAADIEFEMTHTAFEKQLRDIELWKEAQLEKAEAGKETAAIIAESAAKEAEAFEREVDRIKGKIQSLEDKIFEQEHSQYENDLRKLQQERLKYYEEGIYPAELIERYYQNAVGKLNQRASKGGDYTKSPNGGMQRFGNGIMFIGGDQIIDDGLIRNQQQTIGLMTDENRIRSQLIPKLDAEARETVERIQATKELTAVQRELLSQTQSASGFQLIEGDHVVEFQPQIPQIPPMSQLQMPPIPQAQDFSAQRVEESLRQSAEALKEFDSAIQRTNYGIEQSVPLDRLEESFRPPAEAAQNVTSAHNSLAESSRQLPDYFKNLADGVEAVSAMQIGLTKSTMELIDAQSKLRDALNNFSVSNSFQTSNQNQEQLPTDGFTKLSASTRELSESQDLLVRRTRAVEPLPTARREQSPTPRNQESGIQLGFDHDIFGTFATTAITGLEYLTAIGRIAPHPVAKLLALGGAGVLALAKGTYDNTQEANEQFNLSPRLDSREQATSTGGFGDIDLSEITAQISSIDADVKSVLQALQDQSTDTPADNFSELLAPLSNFDAPLSSILQQMQDAQPYENDRLQELFGTLPNIEAYTQSILQQMQAREETITFETIVTPLNNITGLVQNILSSLENRQPPQITVAPNNNIDLGGAYVFDEALKASLVEDITNQIVTAITTTVNQATNKSNYSFAG